MKAKTINAILTKKFDQFLESITDESVKELVKRNTIITGGSIVSMLLNENVSDFDLYFRTKETAIAVAQYYVKEIQKAPPPCFKSDEKHTVKIYVSHAPEVERVRIVVQSAGIITAEQQQKDYQYFEGIADNEEQARAAQAYVDGATEAVTALDEEPATSLEAATSPEGPKYRPLFLTSNAITCANKIQLIIRFYGEPEEIHKNYDFVHCTSYWTSWDKKVVLRPEALESILTRELRYVGSRYPLCSLIRTRKFIKRGWTINAGQFVKMAWQVHELDLTSIAVLDDQLVGVDAAYFIQLIDCLKRGDKENTGKVDTGYLMTLIDRLF